MGKDGIKVVGVRAQACFAGYLYIWAFIALAGTHTSVFLNAVAIMKRRSASAAIADTQLMYRAFCSLHWDSIRLPTEGPVWNGMEELEPCHAGLVGRQACALSA